MFDKHPRATVGAIAAIPVVLFLLTTFMGAQTSTILSTVGASVGGSYQGAEPAPETPADAGGSTGQTGSGSGTTQGQGVVAVQPALLIIRTGKLSLQVSEASSLSSTVSSAANLVGAAGGFVAGSKEQGTADAASATVDYRIPAAAWERTLSGLRGLATVQSQEIGTEEVTGKVIDLGARITNLRATEAALQAIMAKATKIEDVLDVQTQLTDTRGEIEQLSAQKAQLEDRAAYGSLTVAFRVPAAPKRAATPRPAPVWDPGKDVEEATAKLVRVGQRATSAGIWLTIVGLPILVTLALAFGIAWLIWRYISRRLTGTNPSAAG
jgi:hypothetical protein